jgi:hypothetical protein
VTGPSQALIQRVYEILDVIPREEAVQVYIEVPQDLRDLDRRGELDWALLSAMGAWVTDFVEGDRGTLPAAAAPGAAALDLDAVGRAARTPLVRAALDRYGRACTNFAAWALAEGDEAARSLAAELMARLPVDWEIGDAGCPAGG